MSVQSYLSKEICKGGCVIYKVFTLPNNHCIWR